MVVTSPQRQEIQKQSSAPAKYFKWKRLGAIVVWQIVAILFVEFVLYCAGLGEEEIYKLDRQVGFMHMTNKRVTWRSEGFAQSYFDADGMREPGLTVAKPANTYRIALLGDSMVEGLQVPVEQTFGQILSRKLTSATRDKYSQVQVLNFANSGYSTAQDYLQLKNKVFKYKPDLVILGYSNRDIFENWASPDQTITNVRPYALHLPGGHLVIDNSPVLQWMKSPRGKFLNQIAWIREHSRIWGLISAAETQLSFHDPVYRAIGAFLIQPGKTLRGFARSWPDMVKSAFAKSPSFNIQFFEGSHSDATAQKPKETESWAVQSSITRAPDTVPAVKANTTSDPSNRTSAAKEVSATTNESLKEGHERYLQLITRTLGSLLSQMKDECEKHNSQFSVVTMPCREALLPVSNQSKDAFSIDYPQEVRIVSNLCREDAIPLVDCEKTAANLPANHITDVFYAVHLRPFGHQLIADELYPFLLNEIKPAH